MEGQGRMDAAVLAGGINRIPLHENYTPSFKALLTFGDGKPILQRVLDALGGVPEVGGVVIVGPESTLREPLLEPQGYNFIPPGESFGESVIQGLKHFRDSPRVLFLTADLPLLTSQSLADFLRRCRESVEEGDIYLSGVPVSAFKGAYENCPKASSRFLDVTVCHGNLALIKPRALEEKLSEDRLNAIYQARKSPLRTALAFGWPFLLGYLLRCLSLRPFTLEQTMRFTSRWFGLDLVPVLLDAPEIALDIDEPADYAFAKRLLA